MSLFPHQTRISYFSFHRLGRSSVSALQFSFTPQSFRSPTFLISFHSPVPALHLSLSALQLSHQLPLSSSSFPPQSFRSPTFLISFHSSAVLYSLIFPFSHFIHQFFHSPALLLFQSWDLSHPIFRKHNSHYPTNNIL